MSGDNFLENYEGQSTDELIALEATHRIDSLVLAFESAIDSKRKWGKALSKPETVVLAVEAMEREVNNGGFSQFFYNSSVEFAPVIVDSLIAIGCPQAAELTSRAIASLELDTLDPEMIEARMDPDDEELENKLNDIDEQYYEGTEAIADQLFRYIKENKSQITIP
ncbi:MAG: DMP19 family protein [Gammaproteobacteria bacterium]|nr:DMP19 family protein [Gammaproteobacteria bacterium]